MRYLTVAILAAVLSVNVNASEYWLQSVMYVKHYEKNRFDYVEGFDNKAMGIEWRNGNHGAGIETFINSYGDRTNAIHYMNRINYNKGLSFGYTVGVNHGYEDVYKLKFDKGFSRSSSTPMHLGGKMSISASLFTSYEYKNMELSLLTIGVSAAALKFSLRLN